MKRTTAILSLFMLVTSLSNKALSYNDSAEICAGDDATTHELHADDQLYQSNLRRLPTCDEVIEREKIELQDSGKEYSLELGLAYGNKGRILANLALNAMKLNTSCATPGYVVATETEGDFLGALVNLELAVQQDHLANVELGLEFNEGTNSKLTLIVITLECLGKYREAIPIIDKLMRMTTDVEVQKLWMERRRNLILLQGKANRT